MTRQKSFKRLVRIRMAKTGESYTAARRSLLAGTEPPATVDAPQLVCADAKIVAKTGRGWEAWFELLDSWGAFELGHTEVAKKVAAELGIHPLGWAAQAVTTSYERAKGLREVGQRADGTYGTSASKTLAVPADRVLAAVTDADQRARWAGDPRLRFVGVGAGARTLVRFGWGDGPSKVVVHLVAKAAKTTITVEHTRLADAAERDRMQAHWRSALADLQAALAGGGLDA